MENKVAYPKGCNWWCRRKRDVVSIVKSYLTGGVIGAIVTAVDIFTSRIDSDYFTNLALTPVEENYLDKWYVYFKPFYEECLQDSDNLILTNFSNLTKVDELLQKAFSVRDYYAKLKYNPSIGILGPDAFSARQNFCVDEMTNIIKAVMVGANKIARPVDYNYSGIIVNGLTSGKFNVIGKAYSLKSNINEFGGFDLDINLQDIDNTSIIENTVITEVDENTTSTATTPAKNNGLYWLLIAVGTFVTYKVATKEKSKK